MCLKQSSIIKHFWQSEPNTSTTVLLLVLAAVPFTRGGDENGVECAAAAAPPLPVSSSCSTASHRSPVTHHEQQLPHCKRPALQAALSLTQTARCRPYHVRQCNPVPPLLPPVRRSHRCFTITTASSAGPCASLRSSATKSTPRSTSSRPPLRACICPAATLSSTSRRGRPAPTCACRFGPLSCSALPSAARRRQAMRSRLRLPACVWTR